MILNETVESWGGNGGGERERTLMHFPFFIYLFYLNSKRKFFLKKYIETQPKHYKNKNKNFFFYVKALKRSRVGWMAICEFERILSNVFSFPNYLFNLFHRKFAYLSVVCSSKESCHSPEGILSHTFQKKNFFVYGERVSKRRRGGYESFIAL